MSDVRTELLSYSEELPEETQRVKASNALKRIEEWNLFSAPVLVCVCKFGIPHFFRYKLTYCFTDIF